MIRGSPTFWLRSINPSVFSKGTLSKVIYFRRKSKPVFTFIHTALERLSQYYYIVYIRREKITFIFIMISYFNLCNLLDSWNLVIIYRKHLLLTSNFYSRLNIISGIMTALKSEKHLGCAFDFFIVLQMSPRERNKRLWNVVYRCLYRLE